MEGICLLLPKDTKRRSYASCLLGAGTKSSFLLRSQLFCCAYVAWEAFYETRRAKRWVGSYGFGFRICYDPASAEDQDSAESR